MRKSTNILLCLVIASVMSCSTEKKEKERLFFRADTNVRVYNVYHYHSGYPYVHFYPYGVFDNGTYRRTGYYNSKTYNSSVTHNSPVVRGGMGRTGRGGYSIGT